MAGRRVEIRGLSSGLDFTAPEGGEPYVAVIWACDASFDIEQRYQIAKALLQSGCGYIVCGGMECETWHDIADEAWVMDRLYATPADLPPVLTTWHTGESVDQVVYFAFHCTDFSDYRFRYVLVLVVGRAASDREQVITLFATAIAA